MHGAPRNDHLNAAIRVALESLFSKLVNEAAAFFDERLIAAVPDAIAILVCLRWFLSERAVVVGVNHAVVVIVIITGVSTAVSEREAWAALVLLVVIELRGGCDVWVVIDRHFIGPIGNPVSVSVCVYVDNALTLTADRPQRIVKVGCAISHNIASLIDQTALLSGAVPVSLAEAVLLRLDRAAAALDTAR